MFFKQHISILRLIAHLNLDIQNVKNNQKTQNQASKENNLKMNYKKSRKIQNKKI